MTTDLEDYSLARVIKGLYDSEYKTIATDDDGNIIGVFKGIYGTTLHTIKVDSKGRMLAIITDPEDVYGNIHMVGNAELAARLGSINTYDRRGTVVFMEDFEPPALQWATTTSGTGAAVNLSTAQCKSRGQSCKMTTGSTSSRWCTIKKYFGVKVAGKIGCELSFTSDVNTLYFYFYFTYYDGTHLWQGMIKFDGLNGWYTYMDSGQHARLWLTDVNLEQSYYTWHTIKLVIDTSTKEYVRMFLNNVEYDEMDPKGLWSDTDTTKTSLSVEVKHISKSGTNATSYVDDVIITQNEP